MLTQVFGEENVGVLGECPLGIGCGRWAGVLAPFAGLRALDCLLESGVYLANVRAVGEMVDGPGSAGVTGGEGVEGWVGNELSFRSDENILELNSGEGCTTS